MNKQETLKLLKQIGSEIYQNATAVEAAKPCANIDALIESIQAQPDTDYDMAFILAKLIVPSISKGEA